jgi:hypothetical protein
VENGHSHNKVIKLGELTAGPEASTNIFRRSTRLPYYQKLKYGLLNGQTGQGDESIIFQGMTFNISEHGIGIEGTKGFPPNFKVEGILYAGEKTIRFEGTIRWLYHSNSEKWYMGIEVSSRGEEINEIYSTISRTGDFES